MNRCLSFLCAGLFLLVTGCGAPTVGDVGAVRQFFAMDTSMQITVYGPNEEEAASAVVGEINRLEQLLSRTRENSQVSLLNSHAGDGTPVELSGELCDLLALSKEYTAQTQGTFDITVAPLMDAWGFTSDSYRVPSQAELDALLPLADSQNLLVDPQADTAQLLQGGMAIDLGGIAKGYAAGQCVDLLRSYGVESALLQLGGNITAMGTRYDGKPWQVAVRDPQRGDAYVCVLPLQDVTASTSGGYERYFEADGVIYHHILDPDTGYPARSGLLSVTVISQDAPRNDALSTALFVMGEQAALDFWRTDGGFEAVLVCDDGRVLVTEGLEDGLDFRGEENGYTYEIVRR